MKAEIKNCLNILRNGGTILYPTDTIWGIGCDATNSDAVEKVYRLKKRTERKSLIILLADPGKITDYVKSVPEIAWDLIKQVDKPLTIIYPEAKNLAGNVISEDGSVAIRIVKNEFCQLLITSFGKPIVSTSANISGASPPLAFRNIVDEIVNGVDYAVDKKFGEVSELKASRIIKLNQNGEFHVIRP